MSHPPVVQPDSHVALRLPSGVVNIVEVLPNTVISIGKFGALPSNLLIGRPIYTTYEILESDNRSDNHVEIKLRIVPPTELNDLDISDEADTPDAGETTPVVAEDAGANGAATDAIADAALTALKDNRLTVDDPLRQTLTMQQIEELKKADKTSGRDIIKKIMQAHTNLGEKTAFSLAKYALRKTKKYMRQFTVLPVDVGTLSNWLIADKDPARILEIREETLGLINAWSNVYRSEPSTCQDQDQDQDREQDQDQDQDQDARDGLPKIGGSRFLVVDDAGGLIVASLAEKLGILFADSPEAKPSNGMTHRDDIDTSMPDGDLVVDETELSPHEKPIKTTPKRKHATVDLADRNTIHLVHPNSQPNMSLLKYFGYDTNEPPPTHPLHSHLKCLTWLQLLDPTADSTYIEPPTVPETELATWKSGKRGLYYRKRRRWQRCKSIADETRAGGFDGLVIASAHMDAASILNNLVPLVRGGGTVVIYSATIEPLARLVDLCSRDRKTAFLACESAKNEQTVSDGSASVADGDQGDVTLDPRLLLAPTIYTSRVRQWQVLPGRTHPVMSSRGGAEGYVLCARRVLPIEGRVEARGNFTKKRKTGT